MRAYGAAESEVRDVIAMQMTDDVPWSRVLNSICTEPHPFGVQMAALAAHTNLGDPRIFAGTKRIERRVVDLLLTFLHEPSGSGSLVSGGTEANLIAMVVALHAAHAQGRATDGAEVIVSSTVHFSFTKIFTLLGITPVVVPVDSSLRMPVPQTARAITDRTIAVVATAGSSELGIVDPIPQLAAVAGAAGVRMHVDAATGGFIIPFARRLGRNLPAADFSVDDVDSITIDPHKYGLVPVPAGAILFRDPLDATRFAVDSFFAATPTHHTLLGTRPGAAAVATFAVLEHLGWSGFTELTRVNFEVTGYLVRRLRDAGYELLCEPDLNIVVVKVAAAVEVSAQLERAGWIVSTSTRFVEGIRLVVTRHVTHKVVDELIPALNAACAGVADARMPVTQ